MYNILTYSSQDRNGGNSFTRIGAVSSLQLARERAASGDQPSIARAPVRLPQAPPVRAVTEALRGLAVAPTVNVTGESHPPFACLFSFSML